MPRQSGAHDAVGGSGRRVGGHRVAPRDARVDARSHPGILAGQVRDVLAIRRTTTIRSSVARRPSAVHRKAETASFGRRLLVCVIDSHDGRSIGDAQVRSDRASRFSLSRRQSPLRLFSPRQPVVPVQGLADRLSCALLLTGSAGRCVCQIMSSGKCLASGMKRELMRAHRDHASQPRAGAPVSAINSTT
jgi:hypothetical protein